MEKKSQTDPQILPEDDREIEKDSHVSSEGVQDLLKPTLMERLQQKEKFVKTILVELDKKAKSDKGTAGEEEGE